ncbi:hypothetical protein RF11_14739 [Thelohanellus kitauei]|uniref:Uncharacterized protein n=1 Tax=Thelohanellus kitauei TaxID=669202 RepID=A0A0C2JAY1_THEKT|nr:hypothetical protein RF11_14739 [Thelohanellus kitauei]
MGSKHTDTTPGGKFIFTTEHQPLLHMKTPKILKGKRALWIRTLMIRQRSLNDKITNKMVSWVSNGNESTRNVIHDAYRSVAKAGLRLFPANLHCHVVYNALVGQDFNIPDEYSKLLSCIHFQQYDSREDNTDRIFTFAFDENLHLLRQIKGLYLQTDYKEEEYSFFIGILVVSAFVPISDVVDEFDILIDAGYPVLAESIVDYFDDNVIQQLDRRGYRRSRTYSLTPWNFNFYPVQPTNLKVSIELEMKELETLLPTTAIRNVLYRIVYKPDVRTAAKHLKVPSTSKYGCLSSRSRMLSSAKISTRSVSSAQLSCCRKWLMKCRQQGCHGIRSLSREDFHSGKRTLWDRSQRLKVEINSFFMIIDPFSKWAEAEA